MEGSLSLSDLHGGVFPPPQHKKLETQILCDIYEGCVAWHQIQGTKIKQENNKTMREAS